MSVARSRIISSQAPLPVQRPAVKPLRFLLVGQELWVEALEAHLSMQEDMEVLSSITDLDLVPETVSRMNRTVQFIDVILLIWDGSFERNYHLLQSLSSQNQRCLVVSSLISSCELDLIKEAGAWGLCFTTSSFQQLLMAIRRVASGKKHIPSPKVVPTRPADLRVKRQPIFYRERLVAQAEGISWHLSETDIQIISSFSTGASKTDEIAAKVNRQPGTVRTELSSHIYLFLQLLSGVKKIPNRLVAFRILLEFGIFEYK